MKTFLHRREGEEQTTSHQSFIGGTPRLPAGTSSPKCGLCRAELTFFLQLAFPESHPWHGHSLAVFACTAKGDDEHLIPDMLDADELKGAAAPRGFLEKYQQAFRLFVFETARGEAMPGYRPRVAFAPLELLSTKEGAIGLVNGKPKWENGDETPSKVAGSAAVFLLELFKDTKFPTVKGAPPQMEEINRGKPKRAIFANLYSLFVSNFIYFFGASKPSSAVYVLTQR